MGLCVSHVKLYYWKNIYAKRQTGTFQLSIFDIYDRIMQLWSKQKEETMQQVRQMTACHGSPISSPVYVCLLLSGYHKCLLYLIIHID